MMDFPANSRLLKSQQGNKFYDDEFHKRGFFSHGRDTLSPIFMQKIRFIKMNFSRQSAIATLSLHIIKPFKQGM